MRCPFCRHRDSRVVDSRMSESEIRRRRVCEACAGRFTTHERVELTATRVVKKDGRREPFSRDKLAAGVRRACEKRPLSSEAIEALVDDTERQAREHPGDLPSTRIGEIVMERLRGLDQIAYVRFASVYRCFEDTGALRRALDELEGQPVAVP